ncbi:NAD-dependent succinate-semialdehyde dehydrogenase [Robiginitalea sp. M366]|uniref:NAD-dependent succinate-semialdehyde dehydrogenase n=1 Tax=Robiginitalea aestuariiviva TaxID=3036903 RepID=UPI00240D0710|nr:NAD-dependent succinate-semialdehyde dehydrogenase [Robiginitalea aestuariiviva]MDG1572947.1 NAD-dependent succinate-semialdehyde dehydrogenase [Robiginitalea aestuariiviva]
MVRSVNPFNGEVLHTYNPLDAKSLSDRIVQGDQAFESWRETSFDHRKAGMIRVAELLEKNRDHYARTITLEMGKPIAQARAEVEKCAWVCRYYAQEAEGQLASRAIATDAQESYVRYDPLGVILAVMPWNYPFWQVFRFAAPTLMAGNTALLKHASNVWGCGRLLEGIFREAGFSQGVFQHLEVGSDKVAGILEHPAVKAVSLTGSTRAGRAVAAAAGQHIKKAVLELGGSNALVVFEDAALEPTVETCLQARFQNSGQSCIAGKRLLLQSGVADRFLEQLEHQIRGLKSGDPMDPDTYIGVMAREDLAAELEDQLKASLKMGAQLRFGGNRQGAYFEPTLLTGVTPDMPAFRQETFGPLLAVTVFESEEEALRLSGQTPFGLGVSLFTEDAERARRLIPRLDEGAVFINDLVKSDPRLPFGGVKGSGYGRELSEAGIHEFVNAKTVYFKKQ